MSELAVATTALGRKKDENLAILQAIELLEALKEQGVQGQLTVTLDIHTSAQNAVAAGAATLEYLLKTAGEALDSPSSESEAPASTQVKTKETFTVQLPSSKDASTIHFFGTYSEKSVAGAADEKLEEAEDAGAGAGAEAEAGAVAGAGEIVETTDLAKVTPATSSISFTASFDCKDAPEDTSLTCQLDTSSPDIALSMKVSYDSVDALLRSKTFELEENEKACKELALKIREAAMPKQQQPQEGAAGAESSSSKKKSTKKATKAAADDSDAPSGSLVARGQQFYKSAVQHVLMAANVAFETRAFSLFAAASAAIYFYGEFASI